jgi:hypothetical protein
VEEERIGENMDKTTLARNNHYKSWKMDTVLSAVVYV